MTDEQQRTVGADTGEQLERLACVHPAGKQRMQLEQRALGTRSSAPAPTQRFRGLAPSGWRGSRRTRLPSRASATPATSRLALAAIGQLALCVGTRTVGLCVGVTEQPELAGHSHEVLRA